MSRNRGAGLKVLRNRCGDLRWKGMYIDADDDPTVPLSNTRIYWCDQTYKPVGPDGDVVDEDTCTMSRKCFAPL